MASLSGQSDEAIARRHHVSRSRIVLCIQKCLQFGLDAALGELPRPGKPRQLPDDAIAWVQNCACQKPKELGYSYELWTYKLWTAHVRRHCVAAGHPTLQKLSRSKLHKILRKGELRPHKIRYYVERRDPGFEAKMANVLHVYKEVEIINDGLLRGAVLIVRHDRFLRINDFAQPGPVEQVQLVIASENLQREGVLTFVAGRGFVRTSRMKARLRSPPTLERSGPRKPPSPPIMWHSRQRPLAAKIRRPFSTSPSGGLSEAVARRLRMKTTIRQMSSSGRSMAGIADPAIPFLIASKMASSLNRK